MRFFAVRNRTRGTLLATRAWRADTPWARGVGLLGRKGLAEGDGLWIEPCQSIHSFFMRFRFDAAFLDREGRVLHLIHAMPPWRASRFHRLARIVLELPAGTLAASGTEVGDVLVVDEVRTGGSPGG